MDGTNADLKKTGHSNKEPSLVWIALRHFLISILALSGAFVLTDFHAKGQSIREYLLKGAFVSVLTVLIGLWREITLRDRGSKIYLHPDN
jgi:hypothetical protein